MSRRLLATIPSSPHLAVYCAYLGVDHPMSPISLGLLVYESDGFEGASSFRIESVQRQEYPLPDLIRGVLQFDVNRPGEDHSDDCYPVQVVIERHSYPKTLVFDAKGYQPEVRVVKGDSRYAFEVSGVEFSASQFGAKSSDATEAEFPRVKEGVAKHFGITQEEILVVDEPQSE